jgi:hypothetical protein
MTVSAHQWVAGWNNAGTLANIESVVPTFQGIPFAVRSKRMDPGILYTRGDGSVASRGFPIIIWIASGMSDQQYSFIQSTYTPGGIGFYARMTIRTLTGYPSGTATYANFNATLHLPKRSELQDIINAFQDVELVFTVDAAL